MEKEEFEQIVDELMRDYIHQTEENQYVFRVTRKDTLPLYYINSLGRHIRNKYKLWEREWTPEVVNGFDVSDNHPDNLSMKIIEALWDRVQMEGASHE